MKILVEEGNHMGFRSRCVTAFLGSLLACPLWGLAQGGPASSITVPAGTRLSTLKYSDTAGTVVNLKPAEQMAFLFVYGIKDLESQCVSTFFGGPGRLCSLSELISGVKAKSGQILGLNQNPAQDSNYRYTLMIIGNACVITVLPRGAGLGGFAYVGTPGGVGDHIYYNSNGSDLAKGKELGEMGYEGQDFKR